MANTGSLRLVLAGILVTCCSTPSSAQGNRHRSQAPEGELLGQWLEALSNGTVGPSGLSRSAETYDLPSPQVVTPPGSYSLSIAGDFYLGGFVFKDGFPFLHNDGGPSAHNTALGLDALVSSTPGYPTSSSGKYNTALGDASLRNNTRGDSNTASGAFALHNNTRGYRNTASGARALYSNTGGYDNTASGGSALLSNTTGIRNTASGALALYSNTGGYDNTASGVYAMYLNTTGFSNTASGTRALLANTTGTRNTAVGAAAGFANTTGSRNSALGIAAGFYNTTGSNNIWIGSHGVSPGTESNTLRIGTGTGTGYFEQNQAFISGIRGIMTGSADAIAVLIDSNGQLGTMSSSRRVKEEIRDMGEASSDLHRLRPVTFRYKKPFADGEQPIRYGLIAEEVAAVFPELVAYDDEGRPEAVLYHLLDAMLINEIQNQQRTIAEQEAKLRTMKARVERQDAELVELRAIQEQIKRQRAALKDQSGLLAEQGIALREQDAVLRELRARLLRLEAAETVREVPAVKARR